ncbi:hypothetical protein DFH29DRAFT_791511, partial [Suillus ampliporus]
VYKLTYKIIHLTTIILPAWHNIMEDLKFIVTLIPHDVLTCCNSTLDMLKYALKHWKAVDTVIQCHALVLWKLVLVNHEWEIIEQLQDILKILKDTTSFFSCATPNLVTVIPVMDLIYDKLTSYFCNKKYVPTTCSAAHSAKETLNRYYELTDHSEVYHIAMILHPCYKLIYFK